MVGVLPVDPQHVGRCAASEPRSKASVLRGMVPNLPQFNFAHHSKILPQAFKKAAFARPQNFGYVEGQRVEATIMGTRQQRMPHLKPAKSVRNALATEEQKLRESDIKAAQDRLQAHIDKCEATMTGFKRDALRPGDDKKDDPDDPKSPMYGMNPETGERADTGLNLKLTTAKVSDYRINLNNLTFETTYTPVKPKGVSSRISSKDNNPGRKLTSNYARYQQLVKYEGRNCRFFAVLHDTFTEAYEQRKFSIIYFLADDTIQIEEQCAANSGRASFFKTFFSRNKLPRELKVGQVGSIKEHDFITLQDLSVARTLKILGVEFFIYDCDNFTRNHYKETLGIDLPPSIDVSIREPVKVDNATLNQNKKSTNKETLNIDLDGRRLQWSLVQQGECRSFVLIYYLYDDEIRINSVKANGYGELDSGSYVAKKKYMNGKTGKPFVPEDFVMGSEFSIYNKNFTVVGMNNFTKRFFEAKAAGTTRTSSFLAANMTDEQLRLALQRLLISLSKTSANLQKVFRSFDDNKDHVLCFKDFKGMTYYYGFRLTEEDASRLFRYFDTEERAQLTFDEFVNCVYEEDYPVGAEVSSELIKNPALMDAAEKNKLYQDDVKQRKDGTGRPLCMEAWKKRSHELQPFSQTYLDLLRFRVEERLEVREVQRLVQMLCGMIHHKGGKTRHFLYNEFAHRLTAGGASARIRNNQILISNKNTCLNSNRNLGENHVSPNQIYDVFAHVFGKDLFAQRDVNRVLAFLYPDTWTQGCDYVQFLADLLDTHHDFGRCRDVK